MTCCGTLCATALFRRARPANIKAVRCQIWPKPPDTRSTRFKLAQLKSIDDKQIYPLNESYLALHFSHRGVRRVQTGRALAPFVARIFGSTSSATSLSRPSASQYRLHNITVFKMLSIIQSENPQLLYRAKQPQPSPPQSGFDRTCHHSQYRSLARHNILQTQVADPTSNHSFGWQ